VPSEFGKAANGEVEKLRAIVIIFGDVGGHPVAINSEKGGKEKKVGDWLSRGWVANNFETISRGGTLQQ